MDLWILWIPFWFGVSIPSRQVYVSDTDQDQGWPWGVAWNLPKEHRSGCSPGPWGLVQLLAHRGSLQGAPAELWGNDGKTFSVLWDASLNASLQWFGFIPLKYFHSFLRNFCHKILSISLFPVFKTIYSKGKRFSECLSKMKGVFCGTVHSFEDLWVHTLKSKCGSVFVQAIYTPSELRAELMFHLRLQ